MLRFDIKAHLFASYFLWLISSETQTLPTNVFAFVWWVAALQVVSVAINQLQEEFVVFLNTYTFFFFTYECVRSPGGEKKDKTVVIWKRIYLADITKVSPSLLVEDFAEILFTVFISMPVCDYDWSWGRNLCHVGYKATASQSSGLSLKKAKSRFPSGPEDIFLNFVLLQTWTAVIKHLKHPHQSQKPININYNNRCPQNVKTSVN